MDWVLETIPMAQPILPTSEYPVVYRSAISMELSCYIILKALPWTKMVTKFNIK
jgi:hypothetical protein